MKFLVTPASKDAKTHVIAGTTEDLVITAARKRFGGIAWYCATEDTAVEDAQVGPLGMRERPIGSGRGEKGWGAWKT